MKFEKAFVGGTIVEVHWKVLPVKLSAPPSALPPPIPQPSPKKPGLVLLYLHFTLCNVLKFYGSLNFILQFVAFHFVCTGYHLEFLVLKYEACLLYLDTGTMLYRPVQRGNAVHGVFCCSAKWKDSLMFISIPSLVWFFWQ